MAIHKRVVCFWCSAVIAQCRCMSHEGINVVQSYNTCDDCKKAAKAHPQEVRIEDEPRLKEALKDRQDVRDGQHLVKLMEGEEK